MVPLRDHQLPLSDGSDAGRYADKARLIREFYAAGGVSYADTAKKFDIPRLTAQRIIKNLTYKDPDYIFKPNRGVFHEDHFHERLAERYNGLRLSPQEYDDLKSAIQRGGVAIVERKLVKGDWAVNYAYVTKRYPFGPIFVGIWESTGVFSTALPPRQYLLCNGQWLRQPHKKSFGRDIH